MLIFRMKRHWSTVQNIICKALESRVSVWPMAGLILLSACGGHSKTTTSPQPAPMPDKEQVWQLVSIQNRDLTPGGAAVTIVFNPQAGTATGNTSCNEYTFSYSLGTPSVQSTDKLYPVTFTYWGSGTVMCPESDMNAERRYLALLAKTTHLKITPYTITAYQRGKETLRFELQD